MRFSPATLKCLLAAAILVCGLGRLAYAAPAEKETPVVVDLAPFEAQINKRLDDSLAKFRRQNPDTVVSLLAFDYSGLNPGLTIHLDTPENSDAKVKKDPPSVGKDEHGAFNDSPTGAKFELADYGFKGFPDLYKLEGPLSLKYPGGRVVAVKSGDDAIAEAMFNFLVPLLEKHKGYKELKRAPVFRLGVHVENSTRAKFWRVAE